MEKLGVDVETEVTKTATEETQPRCPACAQPLMTNTNVPKCPTCGTRPFEPRR